MADGWTFDQKGFAETVDLLDQLEARTGRLVATRAMRAAARLAVKRLKDDAPIRGRESGPLVKKDKASRSAATRLPGFLRGAVAFRRLKRVPRGAFVYQVSPVRRAYYHRFVVRGEGRGRANPWVGRSWAQNRVAVQAEFNKVLLRETQKELQKALRKHRPK